MPGAERLVMSQRELKRLHVIHGLLEGKLKQMTAAELLDLCVRQVRRVVERVRAEGDEGIIHRGRGRPSNRKTPDWLRGRILERVRRKYGGFGPTLACEKLAKEGLAVSDETLRVWMREAGLEYPRRRQRGHRMWRERKRCFGEMVQLDGSHHDWLEGRGPQMVLMGYVDDATNLAWGRFYQHEGTLPAMDSFKRYVKRYGIPQSVYLDRHTTYKSTAQPTVEEELAGRKPQSQFERALGELEVKVIHAYSPQAKGRVERLFRTLQDRLVKELRLKGVCSQAAANRMLGSYLVGHNRRFGLKPAEELNVARPVPAGMDLDGMLCLKNSRFVRNDGTIIHEKRLYQLEGAKGKEVMVEERVDGKMLVKDGGICLKFKAIDCRPRPNLTLKKPVPSVMKHYVPSKDHPWRKPAVVHQTGHF